MSVKRSISNSLSLISDNSPVLWVKTAFFVMTALIFILIYFELQAYSKLDALSVEQIELASLAKNVEYYDEVLTMSARLAISKRDMSWQKRYKEHVPLLDKAIEDALSSINNFQKISFINQTKTANNELILMEQRALLYASNGQWSDAEKILYGENYSALKIEYAAGLTKLNIYVHDELEKNMQSEQDLLRYEVYLSLMLLVVVIVIGTVVVWVLRRWQQSKNIAYQQLNIANDELEEFAYRTSHDLRSPIISSTRLMDMVKTAIDDGDLNTAKEGLSHARSSLSKLDALIQDILALSETKNKEEESQVINIRAMVDEAVEKMEHLQGFERLNIQKNFDTNIELSTKKSRFNLVLENLISNAIKYQDTNKAESYIVISTRQQGASFVLEVADNGLGVPKDQQKNLFSMFKRFHPRVSFGSGLGLYLMQKSAGMINGVVSFQDHGEGSTFSLTIDLKGDI